MSGAGLGVHAWIFFFGAGMAGDDPNYADVVYSEEDKEFYGVKVKALAFPLRPLPTRPSTHTPFSSSSSSSSTTTTTILERSVVSRRKRRTLLISVFCASWHETDRFRGGCWQRHESGRCCLGGSNSINISNYVNTTRVYL